MTPISADAVNQPRAAGRAATSELRQALAVAAKDVRLEVRSRYALTSLLLFVVVTVSMIVFSAAGEKLSPELAGGVLWIIMFFGGMSGLSRGFVAEEERGTSLLLTISARPEAVYTGKLLMTVALGLVVNVAASGLFLLFSDDVAVKNWPLFGGMLLLGSVSVSASVTILSAIIAKTGAKSTLLPVLAFPVLLPVVLAGIDAAATSFAGRTNDAAATDLQMMVGYSGVVIVVSYLLFRHVWRE